MNPRVFWAVVIVLVVVVASAGGVAYYLVAHPSTPCSLASTNPLVYDIAATPDSFDPADTFTTPGWGAVQQVYQGLVSYNGTNSTTFVPVLAQNWSVSSDGFHWNFTLRSGVTFSNGDPFNAYVMWFSLYRGLVMDQAPQYLMSESFWYPGLNDYNSNLTQVASEITNLTTDLNTFNFTAPTAGELAVMEATNQSFRVLDANTIQLNEGFGYIGDVPFSYLLADLVSPVFSAVDPIYVAAHGGVTAGGANSYLAVNMMGTGPFILTSYNPLTGYSLAPTPNYWGTSVAKTEPGNDAIQPADSSLEFRFQTDTAVEVSDMKTGTVVAASFGYAGTTAAQELAGVHCVDVTKLGPLYGSTEGNYWVYMNQQTPPFGNLSVREAIAHAINITQIIQDAFDGFAYPWVGPVPLAYPFYNPQSLNPYPYDLALAKQEIANSPCRNGCGPFNFDYLTPGTDWFDMATLIQSDLGQIGITIDPVPITLSEMYEEQTVDPTTGHCVASETTNGGPFPIGQQVYSADFIAPSDGTLTQAISWGSANVCDAGYDNSTVDSLVYQAAGSSNPTIEAQDYGEITAAMYDNYSDVWLGVVGTYEVVNSLLQGIVLNPMGSGVPFSMVMNTQHAS